MTNDYKNEGDVPTISGGGLSKDKTESTPPPDIEGYKIIKKIGEGGMGIVYLAQQLAGNGF